MAGEKTKTAGTMAGHLQDLKVRAQKVSGWRFFDEEIRFGRLYLQLESEVSKEIRIGNHRRGDRMATDLAAKLPLYRCNVLDVIDVAVSQEEQFEIDIARADPIASSLWRVEQDPAFRGRNEVAVRLENTAAIRLIVHLAGT